MLYGKLKVTIPIPPITARTHSTLVCLLCGRSRINQNTLMCQQSFVPLKCMVTIRSISWIKLQNEIVDFLQKFINSVILSAVYLYDFLLDVHSIKYHKIIIKHYKILSLSNPMSHFSLFLYYILNSLSSLPYSFVSHMTGVGSATGGAVNVDVTEGVHPPPTTSPCPMCR